jgi:hypothetical protein
MYCKYDVVFRWRDYLIFTLDIVTAAPQNSEFGKNVPGSRQANKSGITTIVES